MKKFRAFTLIETLIVIVVFCIGILAVLHGLSQTLRNKDYADIQIKSAFFAREGIELMFNLRDANYYKELPWNCIFKPNQNPGTINLNNDNNEEKNPFCIGYFGSENSKIIKIGMGSDEYIKVETGTPDDLEDFDDIFEKYQIYLHTGNNVLNGSTGYYYNHEGSDEEKTWFARYILITGVVADENTIDVDKLLKIESHVLYKKGYLTGEKVMETFMGNYEFNEEGGIQLDNALNLNEDLEVNDISDTVLFNSFCLPAFGPINDDDNMKCDLNIDGKIDINDLFLLRSNFGNS